MSPTRDEILRARPLLAECERRGMVFKKAGSEWTAVCPFHQDGRRGNFRVMEAKGTWFCDVCGFGGSVIDYVARLEGKTPGEVLKAFSADLSGGARFEPVQKPAGGRIVATYDYRNEAGDLVYQVVRFEPKKFAQRRMSGGKWAWGMEGVTRVLYRLPELAQAEEAWVVEGEKDADNLRALGFAATCNVGGSGKWLDAYSENLKGKDVVLCGDNDEPGQQHVDKVLVSVRDLARSVKVVRVPEPHKDVSDWIVALAGEDEARAALKGLVASVPVVGGFYLMPVLGVVELEEVYCQFRDNAAAVSLDLARWLPSLKGRVRPLVPGELMVFVADCGVGKTALLQNLAMRSEITTLLFELELPGTLAFERFMAMATGMSCAGVEDWYHVRGPGSLSFANLRHVWVCDKSGMDLESMKKLVRASALKIGKPPSLVLVDYVQLVKGEGKSRYERMSSVAEDLKVLAKELDVIVVAASQIGRKHDGDGPEIGLHDAKNAGEIENSAGVVIGAWRDKDDGATMHLQVLKNTKGIAGTRVRCNFNGATMQITEQSVISDEDVPRMKSVGGER